MLEITTLKSHKRKRYEYYPMPKRETFRLCEVSSCLIGFESSDQDLTTPIIHNIIYEAITKDFNNETKNIHSDSHPRKKLGKSRDEHWRGMVSYLLTKLSWIKSVMFKWVTKLPQNVWPFEFFERFDLWWTMLYTYYASSEIILAYIPFKLFESYIVIICTTLVLNEASFITPRKSMKENKQILTLLCKTNSFCLTKCTVLIMFNI